AALAHEINDRRIRGEDVLPGEMFHFSSEVPGIINRTIDFQSVAFADHKVVVAVTRRGVNGAGAGFTGRLAIARFADVELRFRISFAAECYVVTNHPERHTINPRVPAFESIQFGADEAGQHFWFLRIAFAV